VHSWIPPTIARRVVPLLLLFLMITPVVFADSGPDHKLPQVRPIALGTSGGNGSDFAKAFCYGGTLGSLVDVGGNQYILSNNHVLARTNIGTKAGIGSSNPQAGDDIVQPGLIDVSCQKKSEDVVADLADYVTIQFKNKGTAPPNYVDAAIARVRVGATGSLVDTTGKILDIGTLATGIVEDQLNLAVQKSGRTTGNTHGCIAAVDVTIDINYGNGKTARFFDQFMVDGPSFSEGGDSGSLIVTEKSPPTSSPQAVGLLFAGSSTQTIGNPIGRVLSSFGANMVGSGTASSPTFCGTASTTQDALAREAKRHNEDRLMGVPGAVGVGVGRGGVVEVYLAHANEQARSQIPAHVDNVPVRVIVTGEFQAF
jgi:hypothetical protein